MDTLTSVMDALCEIAQICLYETIFEFGGDLSLYLNVDVLTTTIIKIIAEEEKRRAAEAFRKKDFGDKNKRVFK